MTNRDKNDIWNVLIKYDNTLTYMVFSNYRKMEKEDTNLVDSILGDKILVAVN